jgi:hypothetical protein
LVENQRIENYDHIVPSLEMTKIVGNSELRVFGGVNA